MDSKTAGFEKKNWIRYELDSKKVGFAKSWIRKKFHSKTIGFEKLASEKDGFEKKSWIRKR